MEPSSLLAWFCCDTVSITGSCSSLAIESWVIGTGSCLLLAWDSCAVGMMPSSTSKVTLPAVEGGSSIMLVLDAVLLVTALTSSVLKSPSSDWERWLRDSHVGEPVSYTHLTLPTKRIV